MKKSRTKVKIIKPKGNGLVLAHNPTNISQEFFVASEMADDQAIEQELLGQAMEHYVYGFMQDGKPVTGLSVAGVNEVARQLNRNPRSGCKIRIIPDSLKIERDVDYDGQKGVEARVVAENMVTGETGIGVKFEAYKKTGHKGQYANTFAVEKAVSKAERNAKRKLMPEKVAVEMIKKFVAQNKYASISTPATLPAPMYNQKQIYTPKKETPKNNIDFLSRFINAVARELKITIGKVLTKDQCEEIINKYNDYTSGELKTLKLNQDEAKRRLFDFMSSPMMMKK